jgi:hypothetical protein
VIEQIIHKDSFFINEYLGNANEIEKQIKNILISDKGREKRRIFGGGYQSNNVTFGFDELIKFAIESLAMIRENVTLANFWINLNKGNNYTHQHIHLISDWSAVYYHKICCNKASINFHNLVPAINDSLFEYSPKEKQMIFFKSLQPHSVNPCYGENHERISIAFNFIKI